MEPNQTRELNEQNMKTGESSKPQSWKIYEYQSQIKRHKKTCEYQSQIIKRPVNTRVKS